MPSKTGISIKSLDTRKASQTPFVFEYISPDGEATGIKFHVIGAQARTAQEATNRLVNERRRQEQAKAAAAGARGEDYTPIERDIEFGQKLAASRLVSWEGIDEPYSEQLALELCEGNPDIAQEILRQSNNLANFMKRSSPT